MYLTMEGKGISAQPGQSLLDLVRELDLDQKQLSLRPLAAKLAGEVFTLNYVPVRQKDLEGEGHPIRRAVAASRGMVTLLRYKDALGREVYTRTAQFVVFLALSQLWPEATAKASCTLGSSVFISVEGADTFSTDALKERMQELISHYVDL